jgi:hypothetical protein
LDELLADFLVLADSFLAAVLIVFPDFFAVLEVPAFSPFSAAFDLLYWECFTGVM